MSTKEPPLSFIVGIAEIGWGYSRMLAEATAHICPVREMHVVGKAFHIL